MSTPPPPVGCGNLCCPEIQQFLEILCSRTNRLGPRIPIDYDKRGALDLLGGGRVSHRTPTYPRSISNESVVLEKTRSYAG